MSIRSLDYAAAVFRLGLTIPDDFWQFWQHYYQCDQVQQRLIQDGDPRFRAYNKLLWVIHKEAEKKEK